MSYQIVDEPRPSGLQKFVVNPMFPVFAFMFGGAYISWLWSIFNGVALGSPSLKKEASAVIVGFLATIIYFFLWSLYLKNSSVISERESDLFRFGTILIYLPICYYIYFKQAAAFEIYQYFGGPSRNGFLFIVVSFIVGRQLEMGINRFLSTLFS